MPSEWGICTSPMRAGDCHIPGSRSCPFPPSIEGENSRALERRGERAGRVRDVVLDEMPLIGTVRARALEAGGEVVRGSAGEMARRVDHRGDEEGIPGRLPLGGYRCALGWSGKVNVA